MDSFVYQHGGALENGLLMYRPSIRRQHGMGIGAFMSSIFQRLIPIARSVILPHATKAIQNVAHDFAEGKNLKESLKSNAIGALKGVGNQLLSQTGSGIRRGKKRKRSSTKQKSASKRRKITKKTTKKRKGKSRKRKQLKKNDFITLFD